MQGVVWERVEDGEREVDGQLPRRGRGDDLDERRARVDPREPLVHEPGPTESHAATDTGAKIVAFSEFDPDETFFFRI